VNTFFVTWISVMSVASVGVWALAFREMLKRKYYAVFYPEKTIKVCIHYPNNRFRYFWRVIPSKRRFTVQNKIYFFDEKYLNNCDIFATENKKNELFVEVEGKRYMINEQEFNKGRFDKFPEIHYFQDNPFPLQFKSTGKINITSEELEAMQKNDLFYKLLSLSDQNMLLIFCIILSAVSCMGVIFLIAKNMGYF